MDQRSSTERNAQDPHTETSPKQPRFMVGFLREGESIRERYWFSGPSGEQQARGFYARVIRSNDIAYAELVRVGTRMETIASHFPEPEGGAT